jgi:hypothetical protein
VPRALLAALLLIAAAGAAAADAALSVEVPAGKSKNIRLRNLPGGATLSVGIVTTGKVLVALVSTKDLRKTLFRGVVERRLAFRVAITERGDYILVLSNRGGAEAVEVQAQIRALPAPPPRKAPAPRDYSPRPEKASMSPRLSSI